MLCKYKSITTGTVIFDEKLEKVILVDRHSDSAFPNTKGLPGGNLNIGEAFEEAAKRELREEVKSDIKNLIFSNIYHSENIIMICYATTINKEDCPNLQQMWYNFKDLNNLKLAPNVNEACNNAHKQLSALCDIQNLTTLDYSVKAAAQFVQNHHHQIDGQIGWGHHAGHGDIGTIGTATGILSLIYAGIPANDSLIKSSVNTLMDMAAPDGGWSIKSIERAEGERISITESTCFSLWVLKKIGLSDSESIVANGLNWLIENQYTNGGWGLNESSGRPRVLATSFALFILSQFDTDRKIIQKAMDWLRRVQLPDGGWGICADASNSSIAHTARAIIALNCIDVPQKDCLISDGVKWLLQKYHHQSEQEDIIEIDYLFKGSTRFEFKHAANPLALIALLDSGHAFHEPKLLAIAANIIRNQNRDGSWNHSLTPGFIPIWNMLENIRAIKYLSNDIVKYSPSLVESKYIHTLIHPILEDFIIHEIINPDRPIPRDGGKRPWKAVKGPWKTGLFYLISYAVIMILIAIISSNVSKSILPLVIFGGLLAILVIGALQLSQDRIIDQDTFLKLISKLLEKLTPKSK